MITKTKLLVFKPTDNGNATIYIPFEVDEIIIEHGSLVSEDSIPYILVQSSLWNSVLGFQYATITTVLELVLGIYNMPNKTVFRFKNSTPINGVYKFLFLNPFDLLPIASTEEIRLLITFKSTSNLL